MSIPFLSDIILKKGNKIEFTTEAGASAGSIDIDTSGNLVLSNTAGDVLLGDGASDVYVGDGTNNVDILFEQSGSIKADDGASGVTLTLGSSNTTLAFGGSTSFTDIVSGFSPTTTNSIDIGTNTKPFKDIYAAHHVGGSSINYATSRGWVEDDAPFSSTQVGYYGGNFNRNGSDDENAVVWGIDPFGNKALLWKSILNQSGDNDDGGWNKDITIPANNNIGYLSYFYFKFDFTPNEAGDGQFYHGCGTTAGQTTNLDGNSNTNPYFNNGTIHSSNNGGAFVANRWYLTIGIIQAYNNDTTDTDTITGVYDVNTGEKVRSGSEFKMGNNTTGQRHRAYMYYDTTTDNNENAYFWNPGFHAIDGSEPKLQDLLKRQVYFNDNFKIAFGNSNDLEIYHNGSNSYIDDTGTGSLYIRGANDVNIRKYTGEQMIKAIADGGVEIYYDNVKKFETYSAGVGITGNAYLTSGNHVHFDNGVSNNYYLRKTGTTLEFKTGGTYNFLSGGATFAGDITATASNATISAAESGGATTKIMGASVGRVGTSSNHNLEVLSNNTAAITIDTSQNVGIGVTPAYKLDVGGTSRIQGTVHMFGAVRNYSGDFSLQNGVQDADILLKVNDGGTTTTALTIDGATTNATFAGDITTSGNIILSGAANEIIKSNGSIRLNIDSDANQSDRIFIVSTGSNSELFRVDESGNGTFQGSVTANGTTLTGDQDLSSYISDAAASNITSRKTFTHADGLQILSGNQGNAIRLVTNNYASQIADSFSGNTVKSYIYFDAQSSSNDPGYIMHETSASESNEGVLHLVPSDDNSTGDYVSIHGTNDPDVLKLHTSGLVETVNLQLQLKSGLNNIYLNDDVTVEGDLTVGGKLNITGDIDSYNVNNLDVVDKLITVGKGQTEANSNGSGILVDGSNASLLWDESNNTWDFNKSLDIVGNIGVSGTVDGVDISGLPTFTTVGTAFAQLGDVSVASYVRVNANETLSYLNASQFLSAIGGQAAGNYLTSFDITTQTDSKYLRSDTADTATGKIVLEGNSAAWDTTAPGQATGSLHLDPGVGTDHFGNAITFGASDSSSGTTAQAGIYLRTDGSYGSRMYFATTDSYATGSKVAMYINHNKDVYFLGDIRGANIIVSGTVDGRDVAADGTKLDTIATNADVTPSWVPSSNPNYSTATGVANNADVTPSWVPSSNPSYLTSVAYTDLTGTVPTWNQNTTGTSASSAKLTDGGSLTTHPGTNNLIYTGQISSGTTGLFAATDNSNSVITLNRHSGEYNSQLGFSSNGNIYYRKKSNTANNTQAWKVLAFTDSDTDAANITSGTLPDARLSDNVFVTRSATVGTTSDWDDFVIQGTYGVASGSGAQFTGSNRPITSGGIEPDYRYGHLVVTEDSGGQGIQQTYYPHNGTRVFFRTGWNNSSWTNWAIIWTDRSDGSGSGLDADLLDGQHASAFSTATGVANNADVTPSWVPSSDPGYFKQGSYSAGYTGDMDSLTGFRIIRSTSGSNRAFSGHHNVITIPNTGATQYGAQLAFETGTVADGGIKFRNSNNGTFTSWYRLYHEGHLPTLAELGAQAAGTYSTATGVANNADVTPSWVPSSDPGYLTAHPSISAASTSDNSGRTYIQDITLDSNGHVTGIATATETVTNTNTQLSNSQVIDAIVESTGISNSNKTTIRSNIGAQAAGNYLTGITSSQVTTALGFTPMNSSVTTISSAQAQKLGYITITQAVNLDTVETNASQGATAYGYGDHADAGYLTSFDITTQTDNKYLRSDQSDQVNGNLIYLDNVKAAFGTSSDFQIYHDGTNNIIKNTKHGQNTYLQSENSSGTNQNCIVFGGSSGSVELRYNNANRFLTTTNGSELNGIITLNNKLELSYTSTSGSQFEQPSTAVTTYRVNSDRWRVWMGNGSSETFTVTEGGRIGINDSTPDYTLDVYGNVSNISIYASHDIAAYSDARVKDEIETIPNALDKVNKLRGVTFVRTDEGSTDKRMMGVIAQEVKDILPEVVNERESDGHYSVSYGNMVGVLIEAVKELTAEVEELKKCGKCDNCNCKNK